MGFFDANSMSPSTNQNVRCGSQSETVAKHDFKLTFYTFANKYKIILI